MGVRRPTQSADAQRGEAERRPEPERERSASAKARLGGREAILAALAATRTAPDPIAGFTGDPVRFADLVAAFRDALGAAGGSLVALPDRGALDRALADAEPGAVVIAGGPAVAESGAVWWVPRDEAERRAAFLAERVILVVAREQLVGDLHAAYQQIDPAAAHYGCFVAGPSKTADIEQALVIGAQGPRALDVYLWGRLEP